MTPIVIEPPELRRVRRVSQDGSESVTAPLSVEFAEAVAARAVAHDLYRQVSVEPVDRPATASCTGCTQPVPRARVAAGKSTCEYCEFLPIDLVDVSDYYGVSPAGVR